MKFSREKALSLLRGGRFNSPAHGSLFGRRASIHCGLMVFCGALVPRTKISIALMWSCQPDGTEETYHDLVSLRHNSAPLPTVTAPMAQTAESARATGIRSTAIR